MSKLAEVSAFVEKLDAGLTELLARVRRIEAHLAAEQKARREREEEACGSPPSSG